MQLPKPVAKGGWGGFPTTSSYIRRSCDPWYYSAVEVNDETNYHKSYTSSSELYNLTSRWVVWNNVEFFMTFRWDFWNFVCLTTGGVKNRCFHIVNKIYFNEWVRRRVFFNHIFLTFIPKQVVKLSVKVVKNSTLFHTGRLYDLGFYFILNVKICLLGLLWYTQNRNLLNIPQFVRAGHIYQTQTSTRVLQA